MPTCFLCLCMLGFVVFSASAGQADCVHKVLTGIDNLFGVCGAHASIVHCTQHKNKAAACKKQLGPGGNLITQDITEDVTLGTGTTQATQKWHKAFQACTKGFSCSRAVKLYKPVLDSVQHGLAALVRSHSCQAPKQLKGLRFTISEFTDCGGHGEPSATEGLLKVTKDVLSKLPRKALHHFPAKDIKTWYLQHQNSQDASSASEQGEESGNSEQEESGHDEENHEDDDNDGNDDASPVDGGTQSLREDDVGDYNKHGDHHSGLSEQDPKSDGPSEEEEEQHDQSASEDSGSMLQIKQQKVSVSSAGRPSTALHVRSHDRSWLRVEPAQK